MNYLFLGENDENKKAKIIKIKEQIFSKKDAQKFDYDVLYGAKLDSKVLRKNLLSLPAIAQQRLIIIHDCHKLSPHNKELIVDVLAENPEYLVLILDAEQLTSKDAFVKKIKSYVKVIETASPEKPNVFNMTRAMTMKRNVEALKILAGLFLDGVHPLQIMGGLVWFWDKLRLKLPPEKFEAGLKALQEADLNIKRSRIKADYAIEILVVRLCAIIS